MLTIENIEKLNGLTFKTNAGAVWLITNAHSTGGEIYWITAKIIGDSNAQQKIVHFKLNRELNADENGYIMHNDIQYYGMPAGFNNFTIVGKKNFETPGKFLKILKSAIE